MRLQLAVISSVVLFTLVTVPRSMLGQQNNRHLTIWLIPFELAAEESPKTPDGEKRKKELDRCFEEVTAKQRVTVVNFQSSPDIYHLDALGPDLAYPNRLLIKGQCETLTALDKFAGSNSVHISVRFLWWGPLFQELQAVAERGGKNDNQPSPDVVQIGSTWGPYLGSRDVLAQISSGDGLEWRNGPPKIPQHTLLRYTTDVRLIFYWKRMSAQESSGSWMSAPKTPTDWTEIVTRLKRRIGETGQQIPPMVMPIGYSPNLLHDYLPLLTVGGGEIFNGRTVNLTEDAALNVPRYLAEQATWKDDKSGTVHRALAFPEMTHEEAVQHFMKGEYVAIIEPLHFISRWHGNLIENGLPANFAKPEVKTDSSAQNDRSVPPLKFWDYVGVVAPPHTFMGGTDLVVMKSTREKEELASALSRLLVIDNSLTTALSKLGHLPAQRKDSAEIFGKALSGDEPGAADEIVSVVKGVTMKGGRGQNYPPDGVAWPIELESRDFLELMQRLWRRIGEGDVKQIKLAASDAELSINRRVDTYTWFRKDVLPITWPPLVVATLLFYVFLKTQRARMLDQVRKVRGFASSALLATGEMHSGLPEFLTGGALPKDAVKARMISFGLQGWRRGLEDENWNPAPLGAIIWRAIILSIESTHELDLFRRWKQSHCDPQTFLLKERIIRDKPEMYKGCAPFYFKTSNLTNKRSKLEHIFRMPFLKYSRGWVIKSTVHMPFMFEQILVCLLQNAIKKSFSEENNCATEITLSFDENSGTLSVTNEGDALNETLCDLLNRAPSVVAFEEEVNKLLRGPIENRPGIGLVEAYCIAKQCYGGLTVDRGRPVFHVKLHSN